MNKFESFLFGFTRIFAVVAATIGLGLIVVAGLGLSKDAAHVSLSDINVEDTERATREVALDTPENVSRYLSGDNAKILAGWIENLDHDQKQDFVNNLSEVIDATEAGGFDIDNAINNYRTVKLSRIANGVESYVAAAQKAAIIAAIFGIVLLVVLATLVVAVLAIERNTRK
jgi:hypothetical protein